MSRVVRVHASNASGWDFATGYYWQNVNQTIIDQMVAEGVKAFTNSPTEQQAWMNLIPYVAGQRIAIKVNGNDMPNFTNNQAYINTLPQLINAVIKGLKSALGIPETDIWVIEPSGDSNGRRYFYQYFYDIIHALYPSVPLLDGNDISFGGNSELFVSGINQYITDQLGQVNHLINLVITKAITPIWGLTGTIKSMQGNIQNCMALHGNLSRTTVDNPDVLIYQNPHIQNKTRLIIGDGIFGAWTGIHFTGGYGGTDTLLTPVNDVPKPWITFGNKAPNCLFFALDPVAIDCVMYDHIIRERNAQAEVSGQSLAPFNEPQLLAGAAAGLGIREHGPPHASIDYEEVELAGPPSKGTLIVESAPLSGKQVQIIKV